MRDRHDGAEAWLTLEGSQCLETPEGKLEQKRREIGHPVPEGSLRSIPDTGITGIFSGGTEFTPQFTREAMEAGAIGVGTSRSIFHRFIPPIPQGTFGFIYAAGFEMGECYAVS